MGMRRLGVALFLVVGCACSNSKKTSSLVGTGGGGVSGTGSGGVQGPPGTMTAWTTGMGQKVQATTAPGPGTAVSAATYRDAFATGQVIVRGNGGHLEQVRVTLAGDLSDGAGHALAKENVTFFREAFINFTGTESVGAGNVPAPASSPTSDPRVPDPLIPLIDPYTGAEAGQPFNVDQNQNQPVFIDIHVPKGQAAGTYNGLIHVAAAVGGSGDVPISVTVWALDLPDMREVTTYFQLSIDGVANYHGGVQTCSGGDCFLDVNKPEGSAIVQRYEDLAHAHRIDPGQARVTLPVNGCVAPGASEWADFDAAMGPYMDGSYFSDKVPSSRFNVPFSPGEAFGIDAECSAAEYKALSAAWATHLTSKGWFPQPTNGGFGAVAYAYDEPLAASSDTKEVNAILNKIATDSASLQGGNAAWKAHVIDTVSPIAAPANPATAPLLDSALGVYAVSLSLYDDFWDHGAFYGRKQWPNLFSQGVQLWFYESNSVLPPYPTFASNTLDGLEPVIILWGSWYEKATGFLYWDITHWTTNDPWGPTVEFGKTGDGVLIYPGNHDGAMAPIGSPADVAIHGPIPSYRLKMIRQGLQDWALFRAADKKGLTAFVQQQIDAVYRQFGAEAPAPAGKPYWSTNETMMNAIRAAVVQKLLTP
jgi:hypothetical protein